MAIKYKNIVGTGFDQYVSSSLVTRSKAGDPRTNPHNTRSSNELQYLTNRNAYFRLSSSTQTTTRVKPDPQTTLPNGVSGPVTEPQYLAPFIDYNNSFNDQLAKDNVLQGGTISISGKNNDITSLRKGFNETYKIGDGSADPRDDLGLQPMPGITGVTVGTGGKWQTLMQADIEIIAYNLDQLDVIQKLYMSLGVTCFLEWGHTPYLNNANPPQLINEPEIIDFFNYGGVGNENKKKISKLDLLKQITKKRKDSCGNYDAFLGTVYNFSYDGDKDGAYICKIQLMGSGGMLESLKINNSFNIDFTNPANTDKAVKYSSTLDNALAAMHEYLITAGGALYKKNTDNIVKLNFGKIGPDSFYNQNYTDAVVSSKSNVTYKLAENIGTWGGLLDTIYNSTNYTPINFIKEGNKGILSFKNETDPFKYGNAHQIITGKAETDSPDGVDNLSPITEELFSGYVGQWAGEKQELSFITFGHLMALVNLLGVFVESDNITGKNATPIVYIDFHPDNTEIDLGPIVASLNPHTCLVPFISNINYEKFLQPLDINTPNSPWWKFGEEGNAHKNIDLKKYNRINEVYKPSDFSVDLTYGGGGKLFNALININFARKCLKNTTDSDGNTSVLDFLTKILDGVNQSLGGINNFRPFVDECGLILRIVDEKILKPIEKPNDPRLVIIPSFGLDTLVYDGGFTSAITPKLASQIVIATQGIGGGITEFSEDVLSYQKLNENVLDRFSTYKFIPVSKDRETDQKLKKQEEARQLKSLQRLYDQFYYIYSPSPTSTIDEPDCKNMLGAYKTLQGERSKQTNPKGNNNNNSSILIPLEYSLTLDGISGILPYNAFLIPNNRLPKNYQDRVAFAVFSVNHSFQDNNWLTTLRGQTLLLQGPTKTPNTDTTLPFTPFTGPNPNIIGDEAYNVNFPTVTNTGTVTENTPGLNDSPTGGNITDTTENTETETIVNITTGPDGQQSATFDTVPISSNQDINAAFTFIANNETNGTPELKAYEDKDYTVSAGFTYRIGYGSDTITSTDGTVTSVTRSSRITAEQATLDLKRRIRDEFKPKVVNRLSSRGVNYNSLPLDVKVVFLDLAYNYGTLFYDFVNAWKNGGKQGVITELRRRAALGPGQVPSRREKEINYLNG